MQLMSELLGGERIRLLSSSCELLERGEMEIGLLCPNLWLEVRGLMMPELSGDMYSVPSSEKDEGKLLSSCEMEFGVLGKSGDTIPAYCISPGDGPTPLRERAARLPSADSCDLLSPRERDPAVSAAAVPESLFRRCPPLLPPDPPLLDRSAEPLPSGFVEDADAPCCAGPSSLSVAFSIRR